MKRRPTNVGTYESYMELVGLVATKYPEDEHGKITRAGLSVLRRGRLSGDRSLIRLEAHCMFMLGATKYEVAHKLGKKPEWASEIEALTLKEIPFALMDKRLLNGLQHGNVDEGRDSRITLVKPLTREEYAEELKKLRDILPGKSLKIPLLIRYLTALVKAAKQTETHANSKANQAGAI